MGPHRGVFSRFHAGMAWLKDRDFTVNSDTPWGPSLRGALPKAIEFIAAWVTPLSCSPSPVVHCSLLEEYKVPYLHVWRHLPLPCVTAPDTMLEMKHCMTVMTVSQSIDSSSHRVTGSACCRLCAHCLFPVPGAASRALKSICTFAVGTGFLSCPLLTPPPK